MDQQSMLLMWQDRVDVVMCHALLKVDFFVMLMEICVHLKLFLCVQCKMVRQLTQSIAGANFKNARRTLEEFVFRKWVLVRADKMILVVLDFQLYWMETAMMLVDVSRFFSDLEIQK
jgi:hypothetical protein